MNEACNFQNLNLKCLSGCLETGCSLDQLMNSVCDDLCNSSQCAWDYGACGYCGPSCFIEDLHDCTAECNISSCSPQYFCIDSLFCAPDCTYDLISNGNCDLSCLNRDCDFDGNDCTSLQILPNCYEVQIADQICDQSCNNDLAFWDGWDCACSPGCSPTLLSNSACDEICNTSQCNFDSQKCLICEGNCKVEMIGDGICQNECNVLNCFFDLGDCECAEGCSAILISNDVCDSQCNNIECAYDNGVCQECASGCVASMRHNGVCEFECNSVDCSYDDTDCLCASQCLPDLLLNSICDQECNTLLCNYDNSQCSPCENGCEIWMLGDGKCDQTCNNSLCNYDNSDCLCSFQCTPDLLNNTVCDPACNTFSCNFDNNLCEPCTCDYQLLINNMCDLACNTTACNYDNLQCICPDLCTLEMLNNEICDESCNSPLCAYDNYYCLECADGCKWTDIGDGLCQPSCVVAECLFDLDDCSCNENCDLYDLYDAMCDQECNESRCNFDNFACKQCASGCYLTMLNNGICNPECYLAECAFDLSDCLCSPYCSSTNSCEYECINMYCGYSKTQCEVGEILKTLANSAVLHDVEAVWDPSLCYDIDPDCIYLILNQECDVICNVAECLFDLGRCDTCSNALCISCVGDICIECVSGYYSLMGTCVEFIPIGFTIYEDFPYFLIPSTDVSTQEHPSEIYVSPIQLSHIQDGTITNPFTSLSVALASITSKFTTVYLIPGYHYLSQIILPRPGIVYMSSPNQPLSTKFIYKYVHITTLLCENSNITYCGYTPAVIFYIDTQVILSVKYSAVLEISNIVFDGRFSLNPECLTEKCYYCPYYIEKNGIFYNDKLQAVDPEFSPISCENNWEIAFLTFEQGGSLLLTNVTFTQFRQQLKAIIELNDVFSVFFNVSFVSVQSASSSAVILQNGGSFVWTVGMLEFLNYGYENVEDLELGGFLYIENTVYFHLEYLVFQWNSAFSQSIVRVVNSQMSIVKNSMFMYNWADKIIDVRSTSQEFLQHFVLKSCSFTENVSEKGSLISVDTEKDIRTLLIGSCQFSYNYLANGLGLISLTSKTSSPIYLSETLITGLQFTENQSGGVSCINIQGLSKVIFSNIQILPYTESQLTPSASYINTSVSLGYYLQVDGTMEFSQCISAVHIENTLILANLTNLDIQSQYCRNVFEVNSNKAVISN